MTTTNDITIYDTNSPEVSHLLDFITLKKFKASEAMSEETNAFTADLYILSCKVATCSNRGHGDPIDICILDDDEARERADLIEAKAKHLTMFSGTRPDGSTYSGAWNLETLIGTKVEQMLQAKWVQVKSRTQVLVETSDGKTFSYKRHKKVSDTQATTAEEAVIIEAIKRQNDNWTRIYCLRSIEGGEIIRD